MNGVLNSDSRSRSSPIRRTPFAQMVILAEPPPALVSSRLWPLHTTPTSPERDGGAARPPHRRRRAPPGQPRPAPPPPSSRVAPSLLFRSPSSSFRRPRRRTPAPAAPAASSPSRPRARRLRGHGRIRAPDGVSLCCGYIPRPPAFCPARRMEIVF